MKRRLRRTAALALLVGVTFFYPLLAPPAHRIDLDHLRLVKQGMTEADVEAVFGVPAGGYDWVVQGDAWRVAAFIPLEGAIFDVAGDHQLAFSATTMFISARHGRHCTFKTWYSRHGVYHVAFNEQGRVAATGSWGKSGLKPAWRVWWEKVAGK
jgi:hypothetical protein